MSSPLVHTMPLPTPFAVGPVNTYLVDDDPLTLVDAGPDTGTALVALERGLAEHGRRVEDLERIVLTHQHFDHIGLAQILVDRSGADVCSWAPLAPWLADHDARSASDEVFAESLMLRHGLPQEIVLALRAVVHMMRAFGNPVEVTHTLEDGDTLEFAHRSWRVHHRPGHSPSDTIFHDEASGELFAGDHLIKDISSNAIVARPLIGPPDAPLHPLVGYLESLGRTRALEVSIARPGHRAQIEDHRAVIDAHLAGHEERAARIAGILSVGPATAFEVAREIWGKVAVTQAFLTFSEVFGHLDLLCERGEAVELDDETPVRYALSSFTTTGGQS